MPHLTVIEAGVLGFCALALLMTCKAVLRDAKRAATSRLYLKRLVQAEQDGRETVLHKGDLI